MPNTVDAARAYHARGWVSVPLLPGQKRPEGNEWQNLQSDPEAFEQDFANMNIGVLLGTSSGNLFDVDLDHETIVRLARHFLPKTPAIFGRASKPQSHYLYRAPEDATVRRITFKDVDGQMLAEIRGNGHQTMLPPSVHPSGEDIVWNDPTALPLDCHPETVELALGWACAAAMLVRGWDSWKDSHHDLIGALAGGLIRGGISPAAIETLIRALTLYAGDHEPLDRLRIAYDTIRKFQEDPTEPITGFPALREIIGGERVARLLKWLQLPSVSDSKSDTDNGNANRFVDAFGEDVRFVHEWDAWLLWDGTRWKRDEREAIIGLAREIPGQILAEAVKHPDDTRQKALVKWAMQSQSVNRLLAIPRLARTDERVTIAAEALDSDPFAFNVANGTVNLRTGGITQHDKSEGITLYSPVTYNPRAPYPMWESFLTAVFAGDEELISFVQRCVGYSLSGSTKEQSLFLVNGPQGTGKTTFIETIRLLFGSYGRNADPSTFMQKRNTSRATPEIAQLQGARFVSSSETEENERMASGLVKRLSGSTRITAANLYAAPFEFDPVLKLWIDTNFRPRVSAEDDAIWARIVLLPFEVVFRHTPIEVKDYKSVLKSELPGILRWAVEGCLAWQADGLQRPESVEKALAGYRDENDAVGAFIEDVCITGPDVSCGVRELYHAFSAWAHDTNEYQYKERHFKQIMERRGFYSEKQTGGMRWLGIKPIESAPDAGLSSPIRPDGANPFSRPQA